MKKLLLLFLSVILLASSTVALALDTSDALYTGVIRITNNGTATTNVSVPFTANSTVYIAAGYMNDSANNTAITSSSGATVAYMPGFAGNPWVIQVPSIGTFAIQNDTLFMGGDTDMEGNINYFPDVSGMTVPDHATLELGDNFAISIRGFYLTDNSSSLYIAQKASAVEIFVSPTVSGNITATVVGSANVTATGVSNGVHTILVTIEVR